MNIRKSSMITVFVGCFFATQALATNCNFFEVHISRPILNDYVLSMKNIVMNNGSFLGCQDENDMFHCLFRQNAFYGPDATLSFKRKTDGQIASIRVQQNLCFFEAGNITVKPIRGIWKYTTREGAFVSYQQGKVWLDQVSFDN